MGFARGSSGLRKRQSDTIACNCSLEASQATSTATIHHCPYFRSDRAWLTFEPASPWFLRCSLIDTQVGDASQDKLIFVKMERQKIFFAS